MNICLECSETLENYIQKNSVDECRVDDFRILRRINVLFLFITNLVVSLMLEFALDPLFSFQNSLDWHIGVQAARALDLALISLLGSLTLLLHGFPLHSHRQTLLIPTVLTTISLTLVDYA